MSISGLEQVHKMNLIEIIKKRRSHRDEFKKLPIKKEHINLIIEAAQWSPSPFNTQHWKLFFVTRQESKDKLASLTEKSIIKQFKDSRFLDDNSKWMRLTMEEWKEQGDGVLIEQHVNLPEQLRDKTKLRPLLKNAKHFSIFGHLGAGKIPGKDIAELVRNSPLILLIFLDKERRPPGANWKTWMLLGMGMLIENILLAATSVDIGTQFVSASLEEKKDRDEINKIFDIPFNYEPIGFLRMGYKTHEYKSVRLQSSDFVQFEQDYKEST